MKKQFLIIGMINCLCADILVDKHRELTHLKMSDNNLTFSVIKDYQDYKTVAIHYRKDKNELRRILANEIGYNALEDKKKVMPEGSIIIKIGWSIQKMVSFPSAFEANEIQRIEYMLKDSKRFNANGDNWGYARFVKEDGKYKVWEGGTKSCIACHSSVKKSDYLFSNIQELY